jgi:hypothetical protein
MRAALIVALPAIAGCALNDYGLVRVRRFENESARVVQVQSWGLQVLTVSGDRGATFGYTNRTYVFRRADGPVGVPLDVLRGARSPMRPCESCPRLGDLGTPIFRAGAGVGITLELNREMVGVGVGLRRRAALRLPVDDPTVILLRYESTADTPPYVVIGKEMKP